MALTSYKRDWTVNDPRKESNLGNASFKGKKTSTIKECRVNRVKRVELQTL